MNKNHLKEHEHSHNPKDFKCEHCNQAFFSLYYVKRHMKNVHSEKSIPCDKCAKMFKTRASLKGHYNAIHLSDSERKYRCDTCGQGFSKVVNFRDHQNKHLGLKPHECPARDCDKKYADSTSLYHHKQSCHLIKQIP